MKRSAKRSAKRYASGEGWGLWQGDCLQAMRSMPEASVDAIVCDPPYDLTSGKKGGSGSASVNLRSPYGRARIGTGNGSGGFMGKTWDATGIAFDPATWAEALRVLKPGGHLVAFGGSRTYHRLACAIEDAGFEVRDQLQWLYGSGFPKSLDVSKAIDRSAGVEREDKFEGAFERRNGPTGNRRCEACRKWLVSGDPCRCPRPQDAPATSEAAEWDGWGTALKPAHEPICLARKPLAERTVAANVLAHGAGAINVDACRIGTESTQRDNPGGASTTFHGHMEMPRLSGSPAGRWPANVCLSHSPECEQVGTRRVRADGGTKGGDPGSIYADGRGIPHPQFFNYAASDGTEEVEAWNCAPGCAVRMLDEQAGERTSGGKPGGAPRKNGALKFGLALSAAAEASTGGASRFFYCAKASRSERGQGNTHPTVKPIALMRWLCRLVTPPGGLILDPFAGSGSTGLAAIAEGFRFLGIEREDEYCRIIEARLSAAAPPPDPRALPEGQRALPPSAHEMAHEMAQAA